MKLISKKLTIFAVFYLSIILSIKAAPLKYAKSITGEPKYKEKFSHLDYVNPNAPKGGEFRSSAAGSFDNINPYNGKGIVALGATMQFDTLLYRTNDEPLTKYGLIAQYIEEDPDNYWVIFHINPNARFHDQTEITSNDVKFSFDLLREKGSVFYKKFYQDVEKAEIIDQLKVKFIFKHNKNAELITNLGQFPIFSTQDWKEKDFANSKLFIPNGSGSYKIAKINLGKEIVYERVKNYWGKNLPVNKGRYNFDTISYTYYLNPEVRAQGLLAGEYDCFRVSNPHIWKYLSSIIQNNPKKYEQYILEQLPNNNPQKLLLIYNTRKPFLKNINTRKAISSALDFDWINQHYLYSMHKEAKSYFDGTELASTNSTPSPYEIKILEKWKNKLPKELFTIKYENPKPFTSKNNPQQIQETLAWLESDGWKLVDGKQVNEKGEHLSLSILLPNREYQRVAIFFEQSLKKIGITLNIEFLDNSQFIQKMQKFDYDIIPFTFKHTLYPGIEQKYFFSSQSADLEGSMNLAGIKNPLIDELIDQILFVPNNDIRVATIKALDRVLLWNYYALPLMYVATHPVIYNKKLHHPKNTNVIFFDQSTWWYDEK